MARGALYQREFDRRSARSAARSQRLPGEAPAPRLRGGRADLRAAPRSRGAKSRLLAPSSSAWATSCSANSGFPSASSTTRARTPASSSAKGSRRAGCSVGLGQRLECQRVFRPCRSQSRAARAGLRQSTSIGPDARSASCPIKSSSARSAQWTLRRRGRAAFGGERLKQAAECPRGLPERLGLIGKPESVREAARDQSPVRVAGEEEERGSPVVSRPA